MTEIMHESQREYYIVDEESGRKIQVWEHEAEEYGLENILPRDVLSHKDIVAIRERAEVSEVIEFANKVREAGGGDVISGLLPSIPETPNSCLIANALNFDCSVNGDGIDENGDSIWYMVTEDESIQEKIAEKLGLDTHLVSGVHKSIRLPVEIGLVAEAFDTYRDAELNEHTI